MIRRAIFALCIAVVLGAATLPARADEPQSFLFAGAVPCGFACPNWPLTQELLGYSPCENPGPPGSWADVVVTAPQPPAGKQDVILRLEIFPTIDWDSWICAYNPAGPGGAELSAGQHRVGTPCRSVLGKDTLVPIGCTEEATIGVTPGTKYVLRAYSFSDPTPCPARYTWNFV